MLCVIGFGVRRRIDTMDFQTRSEKNGLKYFETMKEAMGHAKDDETVWKVSFGLPTGERIRLVRYTKVLDEYGNDYEIVWHYEPVVTESDWVEEVVNQMIREADEQGRLMVRCAGCDDLPRPRCRHGYPHSKDGAVCDRMCMEPTEDGQEPARCGLID